MLGTWLVLTCTQDVPKNEPYIQDVPKNEPYIQDVPENEPCTQHVPTGPQCRHIARTSVNHNSTVIGNRIAGTC